MMNCLMSTCAILSTLPQPIRQGHLCDTPAVVLGCRPGVSDEVLILVEGHPEANEDVDDEEDMQHEEDVGRQAVSRAAGAGI